MTKTESTALAAQVRASREYCIDKFPESRHTQIHWSNQLTSSIGNARKGSPNVIKLSMPIVRGILESDGLQAALRAIDETVKHEFAHIAVKYSDAPGHGQEWTANMRTLGQSPERYHHYKCGMELFASGELRAQFTRGTEVIFQYKSTWYRGHVCSHQTKRVHARARTKLVTGEWQPLNHKQFTFTCPWSMAVSELHPVQGSHTRGIR